MILGSAPLRRRLLTPAGFPLEQLSVTVSLGKSLRCRFLKSLAEFLRKAGGLSSASNSVEWRGSQDTCFVRQLKFVNKILIGSLRFPSLFMHNLFWWSAIYSDLTVVVVHQTQTNPGQTFNLPPGLCLLTSCPRVCLSPCGQEVFG